MFKNGKVMNLGTLPSGYESPANNINDRDRCRGSPTTAPDPSSVFGFLGSAARTSGSRARILCALGDVFEADG
jgi:hypothetical protein